MSQFLINYSKIEHFAEITDILHVHTFTCAAVSITKNCTINNIIFITIPQYKSWVKYISLVMQGPLKLYKLMKVRQNSETKIA
jgi:hypothetical protein